MARWNPPLEIEQIKQLALITRQSPHHAESPVLVPLSTESFSAGDFQRVFQRYRTKAGFQSMGRWASPEAFKQFSKVLDLLRQLPSEKAVDEMELALRIGFGGLLQRLNTTLHRTSKLIIMYTDLRK